MRRIGHLLRTPLQVWRPVTLPDGAGGQETTWQQVGELRAKVDQPPSQGAAEEETGDQSRAELRYPIYVLPVADVRRGDQFRHADGRRWRVDAVVAPSGTVYQRCDSELIQVETEA